jgi:hypothetical protein
MLIQGSKISLWLLLMAIIIALVFRSVPFDKVSVFLILLSCVILGRKEITFINPYYLFSLAPLSLLLYFNVGSFYMLDLTHKTYLLAIINMSAFVFALNSTNGYKKTLSYGNINSSNILIVHSVILYILGFSAAFIPPLASVLWVFSIAAITCAMKSKKKIMLIFVALIIVSSIFVGEVSKMHVLLNILTVLIAYEKYYIKTLKQKRRLFTYSLLAGLFMIFAFTFANKERGKYDADAGIKYYSQQGVDWQYANNLFMPYMYMTTAWTNVQYVTENQDTRTYGLWMVKPLLGYFQIDKYFEQEYLLTPWSNFNTFTFITCGFKDFGYWLSVLPSLFLGFFVKKVYSRFLISSSPFDVTTYIIVGLAVAEMFFSNHFFMQSYPFTVVIVMGIYKRLVSHNKKTKAIPSDPNSFNYSKELVYPDGYQD